MESARKTPRIVLLLGGDVMLGRGVDEVIGRTGPEYPFELLKAHTRQADLFFVNLECAISSHDDLFAGASKVFYFKGRPRIAETLRDAGVALVSLANNHALDGGHRGLLDTLAILDGKGIAHVGAGVNRDSAAAPAIVQSRGASIGVLAFCDHQEDFAATEDRPGTRYLDVTSDRAIGELCDQIASLSRRVDHVVIAAHWQRNWVRHIERRYRDLARRMVDAGARIVWGHSPHHFQGVEWFASGLALYSTGDLLDDYAVDADFRNDRQLLFRVMFDVHGVQNAEALPLELEYAHPHAARPEARRWIVERLREFCMEVGSGVVEADPWMQIPPP